MTTKSVTAISEKKAPKSSTATGFHASDGPQFLLKSYPAKRVAHSDNRDHSFRWIATSCSDRSRPVRRNDRHRRLLRACRKRPCDYRTTNHRNELAPPHSITSSARASRVGGTTSP